MNESPACLGTLAVAPGALGKARSDVRKRVPIGRFIRALGRTGYAPPVFQAARDEQPIEGSHLEIDTDSDIDALLGETIVFANVVIGAQDQILSELVTDAKVQAIQIALRGVALQCEGVIRHAVQGHAQSLRIVLVFLLMSNLAEHLSLPCNPVFALQAGAQSARDALLVSKSQRGGVAAILGVIIHLDSREVGTQERR